MASSELCGSRVSLVPETSTITDSFAARLRPSVLDRARCRGLWTRLGTKRFRCEEVLSQPSFTIRLHFRELEVS